MGETPVVLKIEGGVAHVVINRPEAMNAISPAVLDGMEAALREVAGNAAVRGLILSGAGGKALSAGADIAYMSTASAEEVRALAMKAVTVTEMIEAIGKPSVAAIEGYALGGGLELAEACMLRVASRGSRMGHPEVKIGAVAGFGGTTRMARLIGKGRAAELLLTGRALDADEALSVGLINRVTEPGRALDGAVALMRELLSVGPEALRLTWEALHRGASMSEGESLRLGAELFGQAASGEEFRRMTSAFVSRKKPG